MVHKFKEDISHIELPKLFTYPFHYKPHTLSRMAAAQVGEYLLTRKEWHEELEQGKMFGVLVVKTPSGEVGFAAAFSGNLAGSNLHDYFVPPIYDMLQPDEFFRRGEAHISAINRQIEELESSAELAEAKLQLSHIKEFYSRELDDLKQLHKRRKAERDSRRQDPKLSPEEQAALIAESQRDNADMQRKRRQSREAIAEAEATLQGLMEGIDSLRELRRKESAELQQALFREFRLLNAKAEQRDLLELFAGTSQPTPPAGTGECAAPKLLQYAYKNGLRPIAMAEFWWGNSPKGEVRKHGSFYPSCNGKCKPILPFMMEGLEVEPNPLLGIKPPEPRIIWEDDYLVAIDKPCGMLSVEGKTGVMSVERWAEERYPEYKGAKIIHRLDQSTSGLLIVAKNKEAHKALQQQFISRSVRKSYIALLEGELKVERGRISLPLKLDYDNRPRQMVSPQGKSAITEFEVVERKEGRTRVRFYPITGRTHQLRVHAAHFEGLAAAIVGDDLYGEGSYAQRIECGERLNDQNIDSASERLHLHAESIEFEHPITHERIKLECTADF